MWGKKKLSSNNSSDIGKPINIRAPKLPSKKKFIAFVVAVFVLSAGVAGFRFLTYTSEATIMSDATKMMSAKQYDQAYKLLEANQKKEKLVNNVDFYVLISRAAVASNKQDKAKEYAQRGAKIYAESKDRNPTQGYYLQNILSGTYYEQPIPSETDKVTPPTKEQVDDPDFQG